MLLTHFSEAVLSALHAGPYIWSMLLFIASVLCYLATKATAEDSLPWVGATRQPFSKKFATVWSLMNFRTVLFDAYGKYLSRDRPCRVPEFFFGPLVLFPASKLKWILSQPEHILHPTESQHETIQSKYLLWFANGPYEEPLHGMFPRKWTMRRFASSKNATMYEIGQSLNESWGLDTQVWRDVCIYDTLLQIVPRAVWEMLVGTPFCRDPEIIRYSLMIAHSVFPVAQLIRLFPSLMQPLVAQIARLPLRYLYYQISKHLLPLIQKRIEEVERAAQGGNLGTEGQLPNDYLAWLVERARQRKDIGKHTPHEICSLLVGMSFVAMHTTAITGTNTLRCLAYSPPRLGYLDGIREEVERVSLEEDYQWSKSCLFKLNRLNSALRESLRLFPVLATAPVRTLHQDILFDDGFRLSKGTRISIPAYCIHTDESVYPNPYQYDAFRFSRSQEEHAAQSSESDRTDELKEILGFRNLSLVTTSDTWFGFGAGKRACPGRFLANDVLKLLLAEVMLKYEIQPADGDDYSGERQGTVQSWVGTMILPDQKGKISIKRRSDELGGEASS